MNMSGNNMEIEEIIEKQDVELLSSYLQEHN